MWQHAGRHNHDADADIYYASWLTESKRVAYTQAYMTAAPLLLMNSGKVVCRRIAASAASWMCAIAIINKYAPAYYRCECCFKQSNSCSPGGGCFNMRQHVVAARRLVLLCCNTSKCRNAPKIGTIWDQRKYQRLMNPHKSRQNIWSKTFAENNICIGDFWSEQKIRRRRIQIYVVFSTKALLKGEK